MAHSTADIFVRPAQVRRMGSSAHLQAATVGPGSEGEENAHGKAISSSDTASVYSHSSSKKSSSSDKENVAASMARASASGVGGFFKSYAKGFFVDMPVAFAEGSRAVPKLYGGEVADYGVVKDWKSGFIKSGKNLTLGLGEGLADLVVQPYEGAKEKGAVGGIAGVGKGLLSFSSKASSGKLTLAFYLYIVAQMMLTL